MSLIKRNKPTDLAAKKSGTNLTREDLSTVLRYMRAEGKKEAEVIRDLVREAIIARALNGRGQDADTAHLKDAHREVVHAAIETVRAELNRTNELLAHHTGLLEAVVVKAREATALGVEAVTRSELVAQMAEHYWTRTHKSAEGLSAEQIERQITLNREAVAGEVVAVIRLAQAAARRLGSDEGE